jgi:hypothetical protein
MTGLRKIIAGAVKRVDPRPTGSRVRKYSHPAGGGPFVALSWEDANQRILALRKWERKQKRQERRKNRAVGHVGISVYEFLCRWAVKHRGRLDDLSYEAIGAIIGHSRSAVVAACARLKRFGWLDWRRQYVSTGQQGVRGVQVVQTFNAFWIAAPVAALIRLGIRIGRAPIPDDHDCAAKAGAAANKAMDIADSSLGRALDRLGAAVAKRETSNGPDSIRIQIQQASDCVRPVYTKR